MCPAGKFYKIFKKGNFLTPVKIDIKMQKQKIKTWMLKKRIRKGGNMSRRTYALLAITIVFGFLVFPGAASANQAPQVLTTISDQVKEVNFPEYIVDNLNDIFTDPDGDDTLMTFTAQSTDAEVIPSITEISGDYYLQLYSTSGFTGISEITVTAEDSLGATKQTSFYLIVSIRLMAANGKTNDNFGKSVAIFGDYAIIGAPQDSTNGSNAGAAYIYKRELNGSEWQWDQKNKLLAPDGTDNDLFGISVDISGNNAIVGAESDDINNQNNVGSAYIFERSGNNWLYKAKLRASDGSTNDNFGKSVSISGAYSIVGAYKDDDNGNDSGAAYVFEKPDTGWEDMTETQKLLADDGQGYDFFGNKVSIANDYAVITANADDDKGTNAGAAYIFRRLFTGWTQQKKLTANDGNPYDTFGCSADIAAARDGINYYVIVGAKNDVTGGKNQAGSAYIFKGSGSSWTQKQKLTDTAGAAYDYFGTSVSISDAYAIVGIPDSSHNGTASGSAVLYKNNNDVWEPRPMLTAPGAMPYSYMGSAVSVYGYYSIAGAYGVNSNMGAAYIYAVENITGGSLAYPPVISDISDITIRKNSGTTSIDFTVFDVDTESGDLIVDFEIGEKDINLLKGDINLTHTGSDYTMQIPSQNNNGFATIIVQAKDDAGDVDWDTTEEFVMTVNDPPLVSNLMDEYRINESTTGEIEFNVTDNDTPANNVLVSASSDNPMLIVDTNLDPGYTGGSPNNWKLQVTPFSGVSGKAEITLRLEDSHGHVTTEKFTLVVNGAPTIKSVTPDILSMTEDTQSDQIVIKITDDEGDDVVLSFSSTNQDVIANTANNFFVNGNGATSVTVDTEPGVVSEVTLALMPNPDEFTTTPFYVTIDAVDQYGMSAATKSISISEVSDVNDPPVFKNINPNGYSTEEDTSKTILFGVEDPEGLSVTVTAESTRPDLVPNDDLHITVTQLYVPDANGNTHKLVVTPNENVYGALTINLNASDGTGAATAEIALAISPKSDPPVISEIENVTTDEDTWTDWVTFTIYDVDGGIMTVNPIGNPNGSPILTQATVQFDGLDANNQLTLLEGETKEVKFKILPAPDQAGTAASYISVSDESETTTENFDLIVNNTNDPAVIMQLSAMITTDEDTTTEPSGETRFTVRDNDNDILTVTLTSTNTSIIDDSGIQIIGLDPNNQMQASGTPTELTMQLTPKPDQYTEPGSPVILILKVNDGNGSLVTRNIEFVVNPVSDPPEVSEIQNVSVNEDTTTSKIAFTVSDPDGGDVTLSVSTANASTPGLLPVDAAHVTFYGVQAGNKITTVKGVPFSVEVALTPGENLNGTVDVTINAVDNENGSGSSTFTLTVNPVNDPPVLTPEVIPDQMTNEETWTNPPISFQVADPDGDMVTLSVQSLKTWLVPNSDDNIVLGAFGSYNNYPVQTEAGQVHEMTLKLKPAPYQSGMAGIVITARDPGNLTSKKQFILTVNQVNDPPVISAIADQTGIEDAWTSEIDFTISDPDENSWLIVSVTSSDPTIVPNELDHIELIGLGTGDAIQSQPGENVPVKVKLLPAANAFGNTTITVSVSDGEGGTAEETFRLTINPANDPPEIEPYPIGQQNTFEETPTQPISFTVKDVDGGWLTVSVQSMNTTLLPNDNNHIDLGDFGTYNNYPVFTEPGTPVPMSLVLTPARDEWGSAGVIITVKDENNLTDQTQFVLSVTNMNNAPTITEITDKNTNEDVRSAGISFTVNDLEGDELTIAVESSNPALVPDFDIQEDWIRIDGIGIDGTVKPNPGDDETLSMTILPYPDQNGSTELTVSVSDGEYTDTTKFVFTVNPVNDAPFFPAPIGHQSTEEETMSDPIAVMVDDGDGGWITITARSAKPTLVPNDNFHIDFDGFGNSRDIYIEPGSGPLSVDLYLLPAENQYGTTGIILRATDSGGLYTETQFNLSVGQLNDAPSISDIVDQTTAEDTPTAKLDFSVSDSEGNDLTVWAVSSNTNLVPNENIRLFGLGDGGVIYTEPNSPLTLGIQVTPKQNQTGVAEITIYVEDGYATAYSSFAVTVEPVNDAPTISDIGPHACPEDDESQEIGFTVDDIDGDNLIITVDSSNTQLIPVNDNNIILIQNLNEFGFTYLVETQPGISPVPIGLRLKPAANQTGKSIMTITVEDQDGLTDQSQFVFTVSKVNDPPSISNVVDTTTPEETLKEVDFRVTDQDGDLLRILVSSDNPVLIPNNADHLWVVGVNDFDEVDTEPGVPLDLKVAVLPAANETGTANITITAIDNESITDTEVFTITVGGENDAPNITPITDVTTQEDVPAPAIDFEVSDIDGDVLTITVDSDNTDLLPVDDNHFDMYGYGAEYRVNTVSAPGDPFPVELVVTPAANQWGSAVVTVTVTDGTGLIDQSQFLVTVTEVNDRPKISNIANQTMVEETHKDISFTVTDYDGDTLTVTASSGDQTMVQNSSIEIVGVDDYSTVETDPGVPVSLTLRLTSEPNQVGDVDIMVTAVDDSMTPTNTYSTVFTLTITDDQDAPTITGLSNNYSTMEEIRSPVIAFNVNDVDGGVLKIDVVSDNTDIVPNDDTHIDMFGFGMNYRVGTQPGVDEPVELTLLPAADVWGTAVISVTVTDESGLTAFDQFILTVQQMNDTPIISDIPDAETTEYTEISLDFTVDDMDSDILTITPTVMNSSPASLVTVNHIEIDGVDSGNKVNTTAGTPLPLTLRILPEQFQNGEATIRVRATDPSGEMASTTFTLTVLEVQNDPEILSILRQTTEMNVARTVKFTVTDADCEIDPATSRPDMEVVVYSTNTTVVPNENISIPAYLSGESDAAKGIFKYQVTLTPAYNITGTTTMNVEVNDGNAIDTATFEFEVLPKSNAPKILELAEIKYIYEDDLTESLEFWVEDPDTPRSMLSIVASSNKQGLIPNEYLKEQYFTYIRSEGNKHLYRMNLKPAEDANSDELGQATITIAVDDDESTTTRGFILEVISINDSPTISDVNNQYTDENIPVSILFRVDDIETPNQNLDVSVYLSDSPPNYTLVPYGNLTLSNYFEPANQGGPNYELTITPATNKSGVARITIEVDDGSAAQQTAVIKKVFYLNVNAIKDGDINLSGALDLGDVIQALQIISGKAVTAHIGTDATGDAKITYQEAIYVLQCLSGIRNCP